MAPDLLGNKGLGAFSAGMSDPTIRAEMTDRAFGCSAMGQGRKANEDRFLISAWPDGAMLLAVADGMGIGNGGSDIAQRLLEQLTQFHGADQILNQLTNLVMETDKAICGSVPIGAGTTCTIVVLKPGLACGVHVGDSRLYLLRSGRLHQITRDQNMAQFLVEEGKITPEEARSHEARRLLDQCVGCGDCQPEQFLLETRPGDILLLTTDGVHNSMGLEIMSKILNRETELPKLAGALLDAALQTGSRDDRTAVIARVADI